MDSAVIKASLFIGSKVSQLKLLDKNAQMLLSTYLPRNPIKIAAGEIMGNASNYRFEPIEIFHYLNFKPYNNYWAHKKNTNVGAFA